ncbi:hypothetical protein PR048_000872 [Dryococelus australis]|uniref:PRMT5 oligomerisation domain-containing protein n=1 Tax=Dryococelus australis TaxID=614101 RepID=A0ABQ9IGQ7_9NEOP|nr:hypothetical protein PR048_000872 [Dryococelus australis]
MYPAISSAELQPGYASVIRKDSYREPVHLQPGDDVTVHFWRLCNKKNVWYEWCISKPIPGPIHNPNGRSYTIGL